jgi:NADPH:quinone reductase-like Zn-dependent oxidoreductase
MKLRYKIASGFLLVIVAGLTVLAVVLSHNSECEPAPELMAGAESMSAIRYRCYGSPDVLELETVEKPIPGDGELLVRVHAAGVNPYDWHFMRGSPYIMRLASGIGAPKDHRFGVDFAGTVEAVGPGVRNFAPGDGVFGGSTGAFGEYVTVSADGAVARKPDNVSHEQAAGVAIAGLTALQSLRDKGQLQAGQKVLINGASGGVGTFAVQIARAMGADVTGVCSTRNVELVRSIGADHVFDYKKESYIESGEQYDLIVDMVGNHSLQANRKVLKPGGRMVLVGSESSDWLGPFMRPIGAMILSMFVDEDISMILGRLRQEDFVELAGMMERGEVTPVIDRRFTLSEVPDAIRYSESGRARGKIIIDVN